MPSEQANWSKLMWCWVMMGWRARSASFIEAEFKLYRNLANGGANFRKERIKIMMRTHKQGLMSRRRRWVLTLAWLLAILTISISAWAQGRSADPPQG